MDDQQVVLKKKGVRIMNSKYNINSTMQIASAVLVAALGVFFVILFANQAVADENMMLLKGRVTSVDSYDRTFSVSGPAGLITLSADKSTSITLCDRNLGFGNISAGQNVTVTYHEYDGALVADVVDIAPVVLACYNQ